MPGYLAVDLYYIVSLKSLNNLNHHNTNPKYRLNTENGGFTPDKPQGQKAPRDLSGVKPTFDVRLKT